jgi:hypothetical protein
MNYDDYLEAPYVEAGQQEAKVEAAAERLRLDLTDEWLRDSKAFAALLQYPDALLEKHARWLKSRAVERIAELTSEVGEEHATTAAHAAAVQDLDGQEFFERVEENLT